MAWPRHRAFSAGGGLLIALSFTAFPARADDKAGCFDAAEQAQLARHQGDLLTAHKDLLVCAAGGSCPATVRRDCTQWLGEVEAAMPSIVVHARDAAGNDVVDARVRIDGAVVAERIAGTAIPVNPGPHHVQIETAGGAPYEIEIVAVEGQKERLVDATLASPVAPGAREGAAAAVGAEPAETPTRSGGARPWLVGGLAALGFTGLALATGFEIAGQDQYRGEEKTCAPVHDCAASSVSSTREMLYVLVPASFGVGVVSLGAAAGLLLFHGRATTQTAWRFDVTPVPGRGAAGGLAGRF